MEKECVKRKKFNRRKMDTGEAEKASLFIRRGETDIKMNRADLIAMAKDTIKFTEDFMKETGSNKCEEVEVYSPECLREIVDDELFERSFFGTEEASFYIVNADSFEAAYSLKSTLVMNFANAHRPGGGFLNGARAQEESLCRCSTLYKSISSDKAQEMYDYNNTHKNPCDSDYMLLSPNVYVYRSFTGERLNKPFWTSVITVPAPNKCGAASKVSQDILDDVMTERLRKMLFLAARKGYRTLILGAWGCGAFGNDTRRVAAYFYQLFFGEDGLHKFFENVIFAILGDENKIEVFKEVFKDKIEGDDMDSPSMDMDVDKAPVGYYTSKYEYPVCNHTDGVTEINIGYVKGITAGGVPFEAELFEKEESMTMAVIMPAIYNDIYEDKEDEELSDDSTNITDMHYEEKFYDYSVLDMGMVDDMMEENLDVVKNYVNFLENNGIVTFASNLLNGTVFYRVDVLGNDLVKVLITMREGGDFWAYTDLDFKEFPQKRKNLKNTKFKVVK